MKNDNPATQNTSESEVTQQPKTAQDSVLSPCQKECDELKDKLLRVTADLQNFQARVIKERAQWAQEAKIAILKDLLPIVDDFDRALAERKKFTDQHLQSWLEGFELIGKSMVKLLDSYGVREIDCSGTFDPHLHEALISVADQKKSPGTIASVLQKGYSMDGTVIRPAKVSVVQY